MSSVGIVLDPRLGLRSDDVVLAWNEDAEGRRIGVASVPPHEEAIDFSPTIDTIQVVVDLAVGVGGSAVYDLIKIAVARVLPGAESVEVHAFQQEDEQSVVTVVKGDRTI